MQTTPGLNPITPEHLSRADSAALARRRRGRNWALLLVLLAICGLFYAISIVKLAALR
jgi:hypothetical protein